LAGIAGASATFIGYRQTLVDYLSGLLVILLSLTVTQIILSATAGLAGRKQVLSLLRLSVLIATVAVCLFGLYQFFGDLLGLSITQTGLRPQYTKAVFGFPRIQATALEPLYFANYLLMPLLVSAALFITTKKKLFLGILGLISVVFALTVSRGAMIGAVIGFIVLILCLYKSFDRRVLRNVGLAIAGIILLVVGGLTLAGISNPTQGKSAIGTFAGLFGANFNQTATLTQRLDAQKQAWNIFLEKPLIGHGIGGYTWRVLNYPAVRTGGERIIVNNEPLELLAEVGILGTLAYLGFLVTLLWGGLRAGLRETNPERRAWLFGLTAAIIAIWVQYLSFSGFYIIHIWVAYGLLLGFIGMKPAETTK
jgi:O-antigen ligase